jgi:hypothetical protein
MEYSINTELLRDRNGVSVTAGVGRKFRSSKGPLSSVEDRGSRRVNDLGDAESEVTTKRP